MGLPLGPAFTNIFMCHHEQIWLDSCTLYFRPIFYQLYVDDTFLLFRHKKYANPKNFELNCLSCCQSTFHLLIFILSLLITIKSGPSSHTKASFLSPCNPLRCICGTLLVTPCSMVWDWRVSRAGPMPFYWSSCSLPLCLLLFSLSLLSFYGLVLWGWGLRTDRVLIAFSQPCIANLF